MKVFEKKNKSVFFQFPCVHFSFPTVGWHGFLIRSFYHITQKNGTSLKKNFLFPFRKMVRTFGAPCTVTGHPYFNFCFFSILNGFDFCCNRLTNIILRRSKLKNFMTLLFMTQRTSTQVVSADLLLVQKILKAGNCYSARFSLIGFSTFFNLK